MKTTRNLDNLRELLHSAFGFAQFRANQEAVCRAAVAGNDLLLVMPTGSGKSLCYQLPALARGGTALVISPLIALMDDQATKLASLGLRVARIHSGLDRTVSRQACVDYLGGNLDFLLIAPERLRVPGFPEMLAKRQLALIAIDEAHCISQWGHDFRPDYRMLGERLPLLRGTGTNRAPVLALTATATPAVQADIVAQLGMHDPSLFIHGFRRDNLAIEVVEVPVPMRATAVCGLLSDADRRPAIVYAQSRKQAERLADELSQAKDQKSRKRIRAAAYHAGLDAETRERVQKAFQASEVDVVVATIAFGMGIDKADIRTVIHAALPATLEGYYQEIGRAGRDGGPSRTYLMHSYADQRTHDFLLSRDYPPAENLNAVFRMLGSEPEGIDELRERSRLGEEEFDKALEKLEIHGGARVDFSGNVTVGGSGWKKTYSVQAAYRREQFEKVLRFVESHDCRMAALVRHFGDVEDAGRSCRQCDVCDPGGAVLRMFRRASARERGMVQALIDDLRAVDYKAAGTLQRGVPSVAALGRMEFDELLGAMIRTGLIESEDAEYEKDGEVRRFRKIRLTSAGRDVRPGTPLELLLSDGVVPEFGGESAKPVRRKAGRADRVEQTQKLEKTAGNAQSDRRERRAAVEVALSGEGQELAGRLRAWRAEEAKRLKVPVFLVLHDRTVNALAVARPRNPSELLGVEGMGPGKVGRFGDAILSVCAG